MKSHITCSKLLQRINYERKHYKQSVLLILDLDDTVIETSNRKYFIYEQILRKRFDLPALNPILHKYYYNIEELLQSNSIFKSNSNEISKIFLNLLLSNFILVLDQPFLGFKHFIERVKTLNAKIVFLTARTELTVKEGTYNSLRSHGLLPPASKKDSVIMKKKLTISDEIYKKTALEWIMDLYPEDIFIIIDNESINCQIFKETLPRNSLTVRFDSVQKNTTHFSGYHLRNWLM